MQSVHRAAYNFPVKVQYLGELDIIAMLRSCADDGSHDLNIEVLTLDDIVGHLPGPAEMMYIVNTSKLVEDQLQNLRR